MARLFIDGFESGDLESWDALSGSAPLITTRAGMTGNYCMRVYGEWAHKNLGSQSALYGSMRTDVNERNSPIVYFYLGTTVIARIDYDTTNQRVNAIRGNGTAILGQSPIGSYSPFVFHRLQFKYVPDPVSGIFEVKIDGIQVITYTGNTVAGSETAIDGFRLWPNAGYAMHYHDDVVLDNANWIGNTKIVGLVPNGAGNSTQWDPSVGSNYDCVEEVPPSDTDYVSTNVVDEVDTYALSNLPGDVAVVRCVQVQARARLEGAATPQNLNLAVRTTGGDYYSADKAVPTIFTGLSNIWEANPGTSNPWTISEVDAMEAGVRSRT